MPRPYGLILGEGMFKGQKGLGQDDLSDSDLAAATSFLTQNQGEMNISASQMIQSYSPTTQGVLPTDYTPYLVLIGGGVLALLLVTRRR